MKKIWGLGIGDWGYLYKYFKNNKIKYFIYFIILFKNERK